MRASLRICSYPNQLMPLGMNDTSPDWTSAGALTEAIMTK
jgi:hypothetical protein